MVGVNHEFSRELLWREYPTDKRGTYFRQFWDVAPALRPDGAPTQTRSGERLYDIPEIHRWPRASTLGEHDNRQPDPRDERDEIVLVIRGELLKKYPNTVIYAHAGPVATLEPGHRPDPASACSSSSSAPSWPSRRATRSARRSTRPRSTPTSTSSASTSTAEEVKGGSGDSPGRPAGWFFVLKERPGRAALRPRQRARRERVDRHRQRPRLDGHGGGRARAARRAHVRRRGADGAQRRRRGEGRPARRRHQGRARRRQLGPLGLPALPGAGDGRRARGRAAAEGHRRTGRSRDRARRPAPTARGPREGRRAAAEHGPGARCAGHRVTTTARPPRRRRRPPRLGRRGPRPAGGARGVQGLHAIPASTCPGYPTRRRSCCCRCGWRRGSAPARTRPRGRSGPSCGSASTPTTARSPPSTRS